MERDDLEYSLEQEVRELRAIYASRRIMNNFHKASRQTLKYSKDLMLERENNLFNFDPLFLHTFYGFWGWCILHQV